MTVTVSRVSRPYWLAIPATERAAIMAAVPDGARLTVVPGHRAEPGTTDVLANPAIVVPDRAVTGV